MNVSERDIAETNTNLIHFWDGAVDDPNKVGVHILRNELSKERTVRFG